MSKNISDILVISDLDNTLLTAETGIPAFNVEMIHKFQNLGGKFTVATGRSIESVGHYLSQIKLNAPAITYNGGIIYDFEKNKVLSKAVLPLQAKEILIKILKNFPYVGCEIMADNYRIYMVQENAYTHYHVTHEQLSYLNAPIQAIRCQWLKVLFAGTNRQMLELKAFCESLQCDTVDFVMTNDIYFEMMPQGITKGKALHTLCKAENISIQNTIAIGDYYNDIALLQSAGLSVCVANAPQEIKELCQAVVPSCLEGGVGRLLEQIITSYS